MPRDCGLTWWASTWTTRSPCGIGAVHSSTPPPVVTFATPVPVPATAVAVAEVAEAGATVAPSGVAPAAMYDELRHQQRGPLCSLRDHRAIERSLDTAERKKESEGCYSLDGIS